MRLWPDLTQNSLPYANLGFRAIVVYLSILILLRLAGKRQIGQMSATEFVAVLLISNAVQNAMNGGDNSLTGGLLLAAVLIALSWLISVLTYRNRYCRGLFEGTPTLLIHNGKPIEPHLRHERVTRDELKAMCRKQGVHHFGDVRTGILESDGSLTLTRYDDPDGAPKSA